MREDRSCASREGAASAAFDQVATDTKQSGTVSDLKFLDRRLSQAYPTSGDLPVRISPCGQAACSPLADLAATLGGGHIARVISEIDRMRATREEVLPRVNAAGACFGRDVALLYEPFEDGRIVPAAANEWATMLDNAASDDPKAFRSLLCEFENGPLPEHRTRIFQTTQGALDSVEPLATALWAEALAHSGQDLRDYRINQNDFDALKSRYLDIFELALHSLVFTARVANIARRGCTARHSNGYKASLRQALDHSKTLEREQWLIDFPAAAQLYGQLKRATRNDISHGRLRYDHKRGELVYGDGRRNSYLEFLIDYLHACSAAHVLPSRRARGFATGEPKSVSARYANITVTPVRDPLMSPSRRYYVATASRRRVTLEIDSEVASLLQTHATDAHVSEGEIVDRAVRAFDLRALVSAIRSRSDLDEDAAMRLSSEELRAARSEHSNSA